MKNHWEFTSFEHNENVIYFLWILLPLNLQDGSFQFWPDPSNWIQGWLPTRKCNQVWNPTPSSVSYKGVDEAKAELEETVHY